MARDPEDDARPDDERPPPALVTLPAPASAPMPEGGDRAAPAAEPQPGSPRQRGPVVVHMPVDVRSAALVFLAVLAGVFTLRWASAVFIPLMLSLLLTYALAPAVDWLERWHAPRWLGAGVILLGLGGAFGWTGYSLSDSAAELVDALPAAAQKLRLALRTKSTRPSTLDTVQKAASQLEQAAQDGRSPALTPRGVTRVVVERPAFNIRDYLVSGTLGLVTATGQLTLIAFLTYFALCAGDTFRRKLVRMAGPSLQSKKVTVKMLDDITRQIERYLLVQIFTSAVVGVTTGVAFWALGLENAAVWGILAAVTNLIPYVGSLIVMVAAALVAFLQFNSIQMALAIGGASLLVHTIVGNLLTPWLTSRAGRMNPVAVFVAVIFWGWLWGIWGLLLGVPLLMVVKAVCDRVEDLQPIGELLSA
ncbi:AI-2E family transporter [Variovorax sp.]|uniref:AI-2E family transporter n=1 Tax=Variovorax sp. TaxID=1871043 RepID=UPI002D57B07C|nr:AI-2E family transporter [Variovorax sp.]HYP84714.1 AI-2E family transporter [Variovorax sp.]